MAWLEGFLRDLRYGVRALERMHAAHARLDHAGRAGWGTFGGYMRGQLLIALAA